MIDTTPELNLISRLNLQKFSRLLTTFFILLPLSNYSSGQVGLADVELSIAPVAGSVYMIQRPGGGGNIGVQLGPDGVLLVDSLFAPLTEKVVQAVGKVTDEEIRFLVNTHIHIDHVGGNANLADRGVMGAALHLT